MEETAADNIPVRDEIGLVRYLIDSPCEGWKCFWAQYHRIIYKAVGRFRFEANDMEDVVQEISLCLVKDNFRVVREWDSSRSNLLTYLYVIAVSRCLDYLKSNYYRYQKHKATCFENDSDDLPDLLTLLADEEPSPREVLEHLECSAQLDAMLTELIADQQLHELDRQLFHLKMLGLSGKDIAQRLQTTEDNVNTRFYRMKKMLKPKLEALGMLK